MTTKDSSFAFLPFLFAPSMQIINISDHFTRARSQEQAAAPRVFGVIIGAQTGRHIEIANSFEVKVVPDGA